MWLGSALASRISTDVHGVAEAVRRLAEDAARRAPFGGSFGQLAVTCPTCGGAMDRIHHQRSGVVVDVCPSHGSWFDRGEVQRIVELAKSSRGQGGPFREAAALVDPGTRLPTEPAPPEREPDEQLELVEIEEPEAFLDLGAETEGELDLETVEVLLDSLVEPD